MTKRNVLLITAWFVSVCFGWVHMVHSQTPSSDAPDARWWKGNLQTQSYWSDADQMPEEVCAWYKENGFHFVALSDHDRPPVGEMWKEVGISDSPHNISPLVHPKILKKYRQKYGNDWVETREHDGRTEVRLKPVEEFGPLLNEPQRFLVMPSQQIYTQAEDEQGRAHSTNPGVAWLDIANSVVPITSGRGEPDDALQQTVDRVQDLVRSTGRQMLLGVAHPNYAWQVTAEDLVGIDGLRFMEIYTGLAQCNSNGDTLRCSVERIWDILLTRRLAELDMPVIYALASDDAHTFLPIPGTPTWGQPGRGWIMVRAKYLTPESLFRAMERGDFYASSGVTLKDVQYGEKSLSVSIQSEAGVKYRTQYIGTRKGYDQASRAVFDESGQPLRTTRRYSEEIGQILYESRELTSTYTLTGNEIYVRARIVSDRPHPDPSWSGQTEVAWTQPVLPR
jgi:hypothetical protein